MKDGEPFITRLEEAMDEGNIEFIEANMPELERLIAQYQNRFFELATLQQRAMDIRAKHERSAKTRA